MCKQSRCLNSTTLVASSVDSRYDVLLSRRRGWTRTRLKNKSVKISGVYRRAAVRLASFSWYVNAVSDFEDKEGQELIPEPETHQVRAEREGRALYPSRQRLITSTRASADRFTSYELMWWHQPSAVRLGESKRGSGVPERASAASSLTRWTSATGKAGSRNDLTTQLSCLVIISS